MFIKQKLINNIPNPTVVILFSVQGIGISHVHPDE